MSKFDYNRQSITQASIEAGIQTGDTIYCHVSLGRLGRAQEGSALPVACETLLQALREVVGRSGTILIPTYTYSIGRGEVFDVEETPSTIGPFTEYFRTRPEAHRSKEPMLAVSGIGPAANDLFHNLPYTSYGKDSLYDRLVAVRAKICCLGLGIYYATFLHHIEQTMQVPFRFSKQFTGTIRSKGNEELVRWEYFAAPHLENCKANAPRMQALLENRGIVSKVSVGRASLSSIRADVYLEEGKKAFAADPWFTAKGPPCVIDAFE